MAARYATRPFTAFTTCPECGTAGYFPWELPPDPADEDAQPDATEPLDYLTDEAIRAYNALVTLWGGDATRTRNEPPPDATTCDVIRQCPTCSAQWGER